MELPVVILCGGMGTRLREETEFIPKPMVRIGAMPILWHIMKIYHHFGHRDFILCLGYKGEIIRRFFLEYELNSGDVMLDLAGRNTRQLRQGHSIEDWRLILADTGGHTMTGGRLKRIRQYVSGDTFLMTYGDGL